VQKALEIDPQLPEAHTTRAIIAVTYDWRPSEADRIAQRAIELAPSYAPAYYAQSIARLAVLRIDDAARSALKSVELDPLSVPMNYFVGFVYQGGRRPALALEHFHKTLELDPSDGYGTLDSVAQEYETLGRDADAIATYLKAQQINGGNLRDIEECREAARRRGLTGYWEKKLELEQRKGWSGWHFDAFHFASLHAKVGHRDEALRWLRTAYDARSTALWMLNVNKNLDSIRDDSRFRELQRLVGIPRVELAR
jgi:tetratricopeptide (TPR) repeat protein